MLLRACGFLIVFTLLRYLPFIYPLMHGPSSSALRGAGWREGGYSQPASRAMR